MERFKNRKEAGVKLAERLLPFKAENPLILAIPRGGVIPAAEVAQRLGADLDLLVVKKIGAPMNPELAIGAVSEDGTPWYNSRIVGLLGIKTAALKTFAEEKAEEVRTQIRRLRGSRSATPVEGRNIILIDDGIATGATLLAAINLLRTKSPAKIFVASPVASPASIDELDKAADAVISLIAPEYFSAVGDWYEDFREITDREVLRILQAKPSATEAELHP